MAALKIIVGNILFAALMYGWWYYVHGDSGLFIAGAILGFLCMNVGVVLGHSLNTSPAIRPKPISRSKPTVDPALLERIE
jgi:hypothetical protein